ncbi:hypothetical protein [Planococcus lenghuensis]|uniref:Alpha-ribazole-5-phosphate synthase n=1 Tax=Planococcus lenghuensis TaxID=2213202 RepID=A0A1Q2L2L3_9BACL|nr:hypothetical protein [Planococcus lenghuensis]AQQ54307.1 hypothetical protein B0X71_15175 [Planococcus lenghuensis]
MRHALNASEWIITADNSAGIGNKPQDVVRAPDKLVAKLAARVALLEQWAAGSEPEAVIMQNFSGKTHWLRYMAGLDELFSEAQTVTPPISGSSETNMTTMQSGIGVVMFGRQHTQLPGWADLHWYVYGVPLVGEDVLTKTGLMADLGKIRNAFNENAITRIWPVGSKGVAHEAQQLTGRSGTVLAGTLDVDASGGPATCVLVGSVLQDVKELQQHLGTAVVPLVFYE